jgi:hypothetical protein
MEPDRKSWHSWCTIFLLEEFSGTIAGALLNFKMGKQISEEFDQETSV